jgi:hypothetical protein
LFRVTTIDPDGFASCVGAGIDISPPVADKIAVAQVNAIALRRACHEAGARFAAIAAVLIVVIAGQHIVQWQLRPQPPSYLLHGLPVLNTSGNIRLIGNYQQKKISFFEAS